MWWFEFSIMRILAPFIVFSTLEYEVLAAPVTKFQAMSYLQQFGYMDEYNTTGSSVFSDESVTSAINDFQRFAGIPATGILDEPTVNMMDKPRCGIKDKTGDHGSARLGSRWHMKDLAYRISKYPSRLRNKQLVDNEIGRAFKVWSDVTSLKFINHEREHVDLVHIEVIFEKGEHGDGSRFDGQGHTLAHTSSPNCGSDAHFDDEEQWTANEDQGINLFQVAAHEFGHSLGLDHSNVSNSVMSPFYEGYDSGKELSSDDILSIQTLYGPPNGTAVIAPHQRPRGDPDPSGPNLCNDSSIDATTIVDDGRAFVFKGDFYWEIKETGIVDGPRKISEDWDGLPGNIDAAMTWTNGKTYFFKGNLIYRFRNQRMDSEYPKPIHVEFRGIPNNLDAAFVWSGNGKVYFFKGGIYWRYDHCKDPLILSYYPLHINGWIGLPNNIDAALQWSDQKTYFFKGSNFYRFNDKTASVDERLSISEFWLHCRSE